MNKLHLFILVVLAWDCSGLHFRMHDSDASYLQKISARQSDFSSELSSLESDISETKSSLDSDNDLDTKIKILEQGIIRQKKQLNKISLGLIPPMEELDWQCSNLNNTSMKELKSLADGVKTETGKLDQVINGKKGK